MDCPEIIIVNDGSTDNSVDIAKYYAENYPHVRLLHRANAGASVARNRGMDIATGKYIAFVDADDLVYPHMYETLMTMALEDDLDVAQCNADWSERDTGVTRQSIPTDRIRSTGVLTGPDWLRMALFSRRWTHVVWMGVYRREVIEKNNIRFILDYIIRILCGPQSLCLTRCVPVILKNPCISIFCIIILSAD